MASVISNSTANQINISVVKATTYSRFGYARPSNNEKMLGVLPPILPLPAPPADGDLGPLPASQVMTTEEESNDEKDLKTNNGQAKSTAPTSVATHTMPIGIIYPPPDIRKIVDTTSQFVAKNGPEFEKMIFAKIEGNAKMNFLRPSDPYHAYYQHLLAEARAQNQSSSLPSRTTPESDDTTTTLAGDTSDDVSEKPDPSAQFSPVARKVLEPPEAERYTVRLPEGVTSEELDIIKLTAQFVARNGKSFLTGLISREGTNPQFHSLRPTHSMFMFFTSLVDAYSRVLMPSEGLTDKLEKSVADMTTVLERCLHRLEWERSQEQARQKAEDEIEQEQIQIAMIDWHDFVVVETIDFADGEDEDLPPPLTLEEVIRRSKMSTMEEDGVFEPGKVVEMEMDEEEVQMIEEGLGVASLEVNGGNNDSRFATQDAEENETPIRIVKNWKRPEERSASERDPSKYVVSPITGELIPINEMSEHMRISLIDPKYKEQKDRMFAKIRETTLAADDEISKNIVGLARTRPDIFGTTEEEVSNAVKAEIEKELPKQVIWDGHSGSIGRTATQAMSQNNEDQNDVMRSLPGAAPPPPPLTSIPIPRPLPPPPGMVLNIPRPPTNLQYSNQISCGVVAPPPPRPPVVNMINPLKPAPPPMQMMHGFSNRPPMPPSLSVNSPNFPVPPPPGSQFMNLGGPRPFVHMPHQPGMPMAPPPTTPQAMPPPPPEEAPPPLPEEPEPKRQRLDDSVLIPEDQFLAQHSGPARISISVPNASEGNLKGQVLDIAVLSLSETIGSLKEKIAGETQLPANKQKLGGKAGFLKDNLSLAYYNVGPGETLSLSLRERGGRKR